MDKNEISKHLKGTTTVGMVCSDGVVIGADTRATMGDFIANTEVRKVYKIDNNLAMTIAGGVGDAQELIRIIKAQNEIYKMNENTSDVAKVGELAAFDNTSAEQDDAILRAADSCRRGRRRAADLQSGSRSAATRRRTNSR